MMLYLLEHPESQANKIPSRKEEPGDKLPDVRRDTEVMTQPGDDTEINEIIQPHKHNKAGNFLARFALTGFIIKDPFLVDYKK